MDLSSLPSLAKHSSCIQSVAVVITLLLAAFTATQFFFYKKIGVIGKRQFQLISVVLTILAAAFTATRFTLDKKISVLRERQSQKTDSTILQLRTTVQKEETRLKPRTISDRMYAEMRDRLHRYAGESIVITCVLGDAEGVAFATRLVSLFREAGWIVPSGLHQTVFTGPVQGVIITVKDASFWPRAQVVHDVLASGGFKSHAEIKKDPQFGIIVGAKE